MKKHTKISILSLFLATVLYLPVAWAAGGKPQNVTGLSVTSTAPDSMTLSWDSAMDTSEEDPNQEIGLASSYRIYYGKDSVAAGAPFYQEEINTPNNNTSFVLTGLEPETTYYFALTAFDSEGNESVEYSFEVSGETLSPNGTTPDTTAPRVVNAAALSQTQVLVGFSEEVVLPESPQVAFSIVEQINPANNLPVISAQIYPQDPTKKTVVLTTDPQSNGMNYIVTASALVKDTAGNVIDSVTSDAALFEGTNKEPVSLEPATEEATTEMEEENDEETPQTQTTNNQIEPLNCGIANQNLAAETYKNTVTCFENAFKNCTPATYVKVVGTGANQENYQYEIMGLNPSDEQACQVKSKYIKHFNTQWVNKEMICDYNSANSFESEEISALGNLPEAKCSGELHELMTNEITDEPSQTNDTQEPAADVIPPENVTGLTAAFSQMADTFTVALSWIPSLNTAQDLVDQILYQSINQGATYDQGVSLGANATGYDVENLEGGVEYYFKVTTKDAAGNESTGAIQSIRLPQTGLGAGFLMLGSVLGARQLLKRKRKHSLKD